MASFIANHRKKLERLKRVEQQLQRLIDRGASEDKLLTAAAEVRDCRIRVLRARQNQNPERSAEERTAFLRLKDEIDRLRWVTPESILSEFRGC